MKISFENAKELKSGIALVAEDLGFELSSPEEAELSVTVEALDGDELCVRLEQDRATVAFGGGKARFFRALAILVDWKKSGVTENTLHEAPLFSSNGAMVDMSRNAVMNVTTVKFMLRKMALMGMNSYMLYTEDTYEVEGYPYFGYMRGRYTKAELRELDAYALSLGIELIPCIQTLGHLTTALRWSSAAKYTDTPAVLQVGAEETYRLIDSMMRTLEQCFTTRRVHIGMDEVRMLGAGKYYNKNGYRAREELFMEHLLRVKEIVAAHGFSALMWSDMFFRLSAKGMKGYEDYDRRTVLLDEIVEKYPREIQPVYWDYYHDDESFYATNIEKHKQLSEHTMFAGGVWLWSGHTPLFSRSKRFTLPALDACRKGGIREVLATVWHNGSESSLVLSLAGLAWYADYDYRGFYDEESVKACFARATGASYDDFMKTELPAYPHGGEFSMTRVLTYNDPMEGLFDRHLYGVDTRPYYLEVCKQLEGIGEGEFAPAFEVIRAVASLLLDKADFGVRLERAYRENDRETLLELASLCDVIIEKTERLRISHRASWMKYNKPFGWEIHDIRYGGILCRFETTKCRILAYLNGEVSRLEELEEERLRFNCAPEDAPLEFEHYIWVGYNQISNAGIL